MSTEIGICNSGLIKVGGSRITSLSDGSKEAIVCSEQFEKMRDLVLESHPWNFATRRSSLALLPDAPAFGYKNAFQLPPGCLRVLNAECPESSWVREDDQILSNEGTMKVRYIYRVTDLSKYTNLFCETLACRLAVEFAYSIASNATLAETMMKAFRAQFADARTLNGQEGRRPIHVPSDWTNARY